MLRTLNALTFLAWFQSHAAAHVTALTLFLSFLFVPPSSERLSINNAKSRELRLKQAHADAVARLKEAAAKTRDSARKENGMGLFA